MKNYKGITLIALIITIIVMLILAAVTINIAINGGLFEYAEKSATDTKLAKLEEKLWQEYMTLKMNDYQISQREDELIMHGHCPPLLFK